MFIHLTTNLPTAIQRLARRRLLWPLVGLVIVVVLTVIGLRIEGRPWLSPSGGIAIWIGSAWSTETSQQLFDPYTIVHIEHGLVFFAAMALFLTRVSRPWQLFLTVLTEGLWEIYENSLLTIDRYRETTAAIAYQGDSILNSGGDILAAVVGFMLARRFGWRYALIAFFLIELVLLALIHDSLILSTLMLLFPSLGLKSWQLGVTS